MDRERELAIQILDLFEDLLEEHDITIPDEDREGNPEESRLYGSAYYSLEDAITNLLKEKGGRVLVYCSVIVPDFHDAIESGHLVWWDKTRNMIYRV